jgi:hypothetical protein
MTNIRVRLIRHLCDKPLDFYYNIVCLHPVALANDLICRGRFERGTFCRARRLLVCYVVTFLNVTSTTCLGLIMSS